MVNYSHNALDATFSALADPTRRAILARLAARERTVSELAEPFRVSLPAVLKHLRVLERAGLLAQKKEGRVRRCRLEGRPLEQAEQWIDRYRCLWENRYRRLDSLLEEMKKAEKKSRRKRGGTHR
ncbi:MAG TPA: metalloregulator ArsR/SmtB family transcription factor [Candidatus Xenobia bacterium]|nr:metalloregulator ArsR/SmtB family transcription factor [Candidatus Xenobia bacterium]